MNEKREKSGADAASPAIGGRIGQFYSLVGTQLLSVVLLLLLLEMGVRFSLPEITPIDINAETLVTDKGQEPFFERHPFAAFSWIPNARFQHQTVNEDGFVSTRDIPMEKAEGELRILTLGGSSTVGNGNRDEDTYPRVLEALVQSRFLDRKVSVINAAAGGYTTIESLGYLQSRMIHYHPDIVVVMHGWNDMYYFTLSDEELSRWRKNFNLQAMWNPGVSRQMADPMPADVQYLSWSQLYLHLREWVRNSDWFQQDQAVTLEKQYDHVKKMSDGSFQLKMKAINGNALALYYTNLNQLKHLCEQLGIACYSVLQPTLISAQSNQDSPRIKQAAQTAALYHAFDFNTHVAVFQEIYKINRNLFGEHVVDAASSMNGKEELFFDHIHQNSQGTRKLAQLIYDKLLEDLGDGTP